MDKITLYKSIVKQFMEEVEKITPALDYDGTENQLIIDEKRGRYLMVGVGWGKNGWFYANFLHIEVKPTAKVWIHHDGTDLVVVRELMEKGIPAYDIVLGFESPQRRVLQPEFANE